MDVAKGIDPFIHSLTIASACHFVYRSLYMPSMSFALYPYFGYQNRQASSIKEIFWLKWKAQTLNIKIVHALNGKQCKINHF
jgi:hypothetical protein